MMEAVKGLCRRAVSLLENGEPKEPLWRLAPEVAAKFEAACEPPPSRRATPSAMGSMDEPSQRSRRPRFVTTLRKAGSMPRWFKRGVVYRGLGVDPELIKELETSQLTPATFHRDPAKRDGSRQGRRRRSAALRSAKLRLACS